MLVNQSWILLKSRSEKKNNGLKRKRKNLRNCFASNLKYKKLPIFSSYLLRMFKKQLTRSLIPRKDLSEVRLGIRMKLMNYGRLTFHRFALPQSQLMKMISQSSNAMNLRKNTPFIMVIAHAISQINIRLIS